MPNTLQNIIKKLKKRSHLKLVNEHFSNEIVLNESVQCCILGDINFFNVDFIAVRSIKLSNSKQSIDSEESSNLEKILKDMNSIISTDQDDMANS